MNATSALAIGLACVGLLNVGGCTTASGLDASSKFSCSAPDGVTCLSVSGIYANSKAGTLPAMQPKSAGSFEAAGTRSVVPAAPGGQPREIVAYNAPANTVSFGGATQKTTAKAMSAPHSGAPLRTPERIVRVWMAPFEDAEGDLHDQKYFYVTVTPGSWTIEAARVNI
jgi:conjugal transfer pilus assembly protein TraV